MLPSESFVTASPTFSVSEIARFVVFVTGDIAGAIPSTRFAEEEGTAADTRVGVILVFFAFLEAGATRADGKGSVSQGGRGGNSTGALRCCFCFTWALQSAWSPWVIEELVGTLREAAVVPEGGGVYTLPRSSGEKLTIEILCKHPY